MLDERTGRVFVLQLPYPRPPKRKNMRFGHWSVERRIDAMLGSDAWKLAKAAKIPPLARVDVELVYRPGNNRRQDPDGIAPTLSGLLDGIVLAGVIPDDSGRYVRRTDQRIVLLDDDPEHRTTPSTTLEIYEVEKRWNRQLPILNPGSRTP